ncbi:MAG: helicase-related protein [Reyranellaceae bacterium]
MNEFPFPPRADASGSRLIAVLGPTNTGKTYLAIERMLGHASGMIGFPLRLLARENYDRVMRLVGAHKVALITGEEKIVPPSPSYFLCTVESMPLDRPVRFLAIDEIQMAADPERGHFFTERLLGARGMDETMLLGADTIRPLLARLTPDAQYIARTRFSTLSYTGPKKLTRLPRRSAVVGFSAAEVYGIAELIRRQRGGAAVVMGALSPRTRNAQVAMFQEGEVDYIVATDAIGMGLNMDVNHVAFASITKFDGRAMRPLSPSELGQIAGRAGRHMNDGTFGTTAEVGPLDAALVEQIENHRFDPLKALMWRNAALDFASLRRLQDSLNEPPPLAGLQRARDADDVLALAALAQQPDILAAAASRQRVRLLWDVCQVPDFRKTMSEEHTRLLAQIYRYLTAAHERLPADWADRQIKRLERFDGDIDTLMSRIAHTRTWTYISHRSGWLDDAAAWQERTRALEDRLSDALHERLMQRFVDRRTALLVRRLKDQEDFMASVDADNGEVHAEGQFLGRIEGFRFVPDMAASHGDQRAVMSAALRVLRQDMPARLQRYAEAPDAEFSLTPDLRIAWKGGAVARLLPGEDILAPKLEVLPSDLLDGPGRETVRKRAADWLNGLVKKHLGELLQGREGDIAPAARGIMFQLAERLGIMPRQPIEEQLAALDETSRKVLGRLGVRLGIYTVYLPTMLKPAALKVRALLYAVARGLESVPPLPAEGRTSVDLGPGADRDFMAAIGYLPLGSLAIRADMVERLSASARKAVRDSREAHERRQKEARAAEVAAANAARAEAPAAGIVLDATSEAEPHLSPADPVTDEAAVVAGGGDEGVLIVDSAPASALEPVLVDIAAAAPAGDSEPAPIADAPLAQAPAAEAPITDAGADAVQAGGEAPVAVDGAATAAAAAAGEPARLSLPELPPGHFRATPEMMSLVGCSEPEMAAILRDIGYRVHGVPGGEGPSSFSMRPRHQRQNFRGPQDGQRHGDRQGDRHGDRQGENRGGREGEPRKRRRPWKDRPPRQEGEPAPQPAAAGEAPAATAATADATPQPNRRDERRERRREDRPREGQARDDRPREDRQRQDRPREDRPREDRPREDRPREDRPREERRADQPRENRRNERRDRNDRRDRDRDRGADAVVASTGPAAESPFAKLKELGLFK